MLPPALCVSTSVDPDVCPDPAAVTLGEELDADINRSASIPWFRRTISCSCARRDIRGDRPPCARGVFHRDVGTAMARAVDRSPGHAVVARYRGRGLCALDPAAELA